MSKMKWRLRVCRAVSGLLAAVTVVSGLTVYGGAVRAATQEDRDKYSDNDTVHGYENDIAAYEREQERIRGEIAKLNNDLKDAAAKKAYYDELIEVTERKISETEKQIVELDNKIVELEVSIGKNTAESEKLYEQVKERIRISYESGGATYLELIFGAESLTDFLIGLDSAVRLLEYDTSILNEYEEMLAKLDADKVKYEESVARQQELYSSLESERVKAESDRRDCEKMIASLTKDTESQKALLAEFDKKIDEASKKIDAYIDELIRQEGIKQSVAEGKYMWPLPTNYTTITSSFGPRKDPFGSGVIKGHGGTDIWCPKGTDVYASNNGTVIRAERDSSYGNYVLIDHGGGIYTLYAHCDKLLVSAGDDVKKGDVIAKSGDTGNVTGAHLHFEVREGSTRVDAMGYVKKP